MPTWTRLQVVESIPFPCKNGIVHRAGKSIMRCCCMGIRWLTMGGLELSSVCLWSKFTLISVVVYKNFEGLMYFICIPLTNRPISLEKLQYSALPCSYFTSFLNRRRIWTSKHSSLLSFLFGVADCHTWESCYCYVYYHVLFYWQVLWLVSMEMDTVGQYIWRNVMYIMCPNKSMDKM